MTALLLALALVAGPLIRSPGGGPGGESVDEIFSAQTARAQWCGFGASCTGMIPNVSAVGSSSFPAMAATRYGQFPRVRFTSSASTNQTSNWTMPAAGAASGYFSPTYGVQTSITIGFATGFAVGQRALIGMFVGDTAVPIGSASPSASVNTAYFGFDSADSTWQFCTNDGAGSATCSDTGIAVTTVGMFNFSVTVLPGGTSYAYTMKRLDTDGVSVSGTRTTDLPEVTLMYRLIHWVSTGTVGTAILSEPGSMFYLLPY